MQKRVLLLSMAISALMSISSFAGSWQSDSIGWWYLNDDDSYPVNTWLWIDGNNDGIAESYHFNSAGYLDVNTTVEGYEVNADGAWVINGVPQTQTISQPVAPAFDSSSVSSSSHNNGSTVQNYSRSSSSQNTSIGNMVYVSRTGTKYHRDPTCGNMRDPIEMTLDEALASGRSACQKCY